MKLHGPQMGFPLPSVSEWLCCAQLSLPMTLKFLVKMETAFWRFWS